MTFLSENIFKTSFLCHLLLWLLQYPASVVSWDYVIAVNDHLEFYYENKTIESSSVRLTNLSAVAYDAASQIVYLSYQDEGKYVISSARNKYQTTCLHYVKHTHNPNRVHSMAYDPVTQQLFWTDLRNIYSLFVISKSQNSENDARILVSSEINGRPNGIAVDSCRGVIYWTNNKYGNSSIESIKIDGTDRKTIVNTNLTSPHGITIDQKLKRIYWIDDLIGIHFNIEYSNLDGTNKVTISPNSNQQPIHIAVNKNKLYYTDKTSFTINECDIETDDIRAEVLLKFPTEPFAFVLNIDILESFDGAECRAARKTVLSRISVPKNHSNDDSEYCLFGGVLIPPKNDILSGKKVCNCSQGYIGERCETYVCHNYCVHGSCFVNDDGLPVCRCNRDYSGLRCEDLICINGKVRGNNKICECLPGWSGDRCDEPQTIISSAIGENSNETVESQNLSNSETNETSNIILAQNSVQSPMENVCGNTVDLSSNSMSIILSLGAIICILLILMAYTIYKIKILRRRPRIIKRIIAKKNGTPLTIRPNQNDCEITIENCCNMNICETPCFEPENFRDHLIDFKTKDEKKNLLANMNQELNY